MLNLIVLTLIAAVIYKLIKAFKCPPELKNLPSASILSYFKLALSDRGYDEKFNDYFQPLIDEYGDIRIFTENGWTLLIGDPKTAKEVCLKSDIFVKPNINPKETNPLILKFVGPSTVGANNGEEWKRHRKIINPIFNRSWTTELFGDCVLDLIGEWSKFDGEEVEVYDLIQRMTLDVLGKAIFNLDFKTVVNKNSKLFNLSNAITKPLFEQFQYLIFPFLENVPFFKRPQLKSDLEDYDAFIEELMDLRGSELKDGTIGEKDDLISALMKSNENEEGKNLTRDEIRDNLKVFIFAGHDTTSNTLATTLYYLARYPEIQTKLREEILEAMNHPKEVKVPSIKELKEIPLLDLVNKESMRIMTTACSLNRTTAETYTLSNGLTVPKGTFLHLNLWAVHHNSQAFRDPDHFNPSRFKDIGSTESRNWQPFITGNRSCIGTTFSILEQRVTISMLLQKFEFFINSSNSDWKNLKLSKNGVIRPKNLSIGLKSII